MTTRWLTLDEVRLMHDTALEADGGLAGERDPGALESALAQPSAEYFGQALHPTLEEQAAAYFFHIVQAHAFIDGNKRAAVLAALTFLELNGREPSINQAEAFDLALATARGELTKVDLAPYFCWS